MRRGRVVVSVTGSLMGESLPSAPPAAGCCGPGDRPGTAAERLRAGGERARLDTTKGSAVDQMVFINLPVADLDRAVGFYEALGYSVNPDFTDETAACIVVSGTVYVMLLTHAKFQEFTDKSIADPGTIEVINSLSATSKDEVHRIVDAAVMSGGNEDRPETDLGFMYQRSFTDPDGHRWEYVWMDEQAMTDGPPSA